MLKILTVYFDAADAARIDQFWFKLLKDLNKTATQLPRSAVLRALTSKGLALAEGQEIKPSTLYDGDAVQIAYKIDDADYDRLLVIVDRWKEKDVPHLVSIQRALLWLALEVLESDRDTSFETTVLDARIGRR